MENTFSFYRSQQAKEVEKNIPLESYIGFVKQGAYQDCVIEGRLAKQRGDLEAYKRIKGKAPVITGSAVMHDGSKEEKNIKSLNGLIVIDIDKELTPDQITSLKQDKYTRILHASFGGEGVCVFVKISMAKDFRDSFHGLAQYYYDTFGITVDHSCSNPNRLRYISYDPDLFENEKAAMFVAKARPKKKEPVREFIFTESDFDNILAQIKTHHYDLCKEDYERYVRIGMSIASKFGASGSEYFHFICQFGSKYKFKDAEKDYKGFCANGQGKVSIATFYYYCKEFGIEVYSDKTKQIINRVKISKAQGSPTVETVTQNMKVVHGVECDDKDKDLIKRLIESKTDYSKEANDDLSEIEQLEQFITMTYEPVRDKIKNAIFLNGNPEAMKDRDVNDIYINCKKNFDFAVNKEDVRSVINSSATKDYDPIKEFFGKEDIHGECGYIEEYIKCIEPYKEYNLWAFKKWLVGAIHNWTCPLNDKIVSPLTLVLTGGKHGTGKTSFFRNILPEALEDYFTQVKIDGKDKDSVFMLCNSLIAFDDEFGGRAIKDVKDYKAVSDIDRVKMRRAFGREVEEFRRRAALAGTSNELDILMDFTGNRRILPVVVERVRYDEMLKVDTVKMLHEAYALLKSGFDWKIRTDDDMNYLKENTGDNETVMPIEEIFFNHFALEKEGSFTEAVVLSQGEIIEYFLANSLSKMTKFELKDIITKNKLKYQTHRINHSDKPKKGFLLFRKYTSDGFGYDKKPAD